MKGIDVVAMTKDSIGWGAMVAMSSILLARKGFTGVNPIFPDGPGPGLVKGLAGDWLILDLYHKPYACCYWVQAPIAGTLALIKAHDISPEQITQIRVRSFQEATRLSCAVPSDTEEAQYNLAYGVACAVLKALMPVPLTWASGSCMAATTFIIPALIMACVQGGVLPL